MSADSAGFDGPSAKFTWTETPELEPVTDFSALQLASMACAVCSKDQRDDAESHNTAREAVRCAVIGTGSSLVAIVCAIVLMRRFSEADTRERLCAYTGSQLATIALMISSKIHESDFDDYRVLRDWVGSVGHLNVFRSDKDAARLERLLCVLVDHRFMVRDVEYERELQVLCDSTSGTLGGYWSGVA